MEMFFEVCEDFCFVFFYYYFVSLFCFLVLSLLLGNVAFSPLFFFVSLYVWRCFCFFVVIFIFFIDFSYPFWVLRNVVLSFFPFWSPFRCDFFLSFSLLFISFPRKCCLLFDVFVIFFLSMLLFCFSEKMCSFFHSFYIDFSSLDTLKKMSLSSLFSLFFLFWFCLGFPFVRIKRQILIFTFPFAFSFLHFEICKKMGISFLDVFVFVFWIFSFPFFFSIKKKSWSSPFILSLFFFSHSSLLKILVTVFFNSRNI